MSENAQNINGEDTLNKSNESKEKKIGLKQIIKSGLGGTVGGPIFVILGSAIAVAKSGLLISLVLNSILMLIFIMIFTELALSLPGSGGGYSFSKEIIGSGWGFFIGWLMWVGNILFTTLSALGFALSFGVFLPAQSKIESTSIIIAVSTTIIIIIFILYFTKREKLNLIMKFFTYALVVGFLVYILVSFIAGPITNKENFSSEIISEDTNFSSIFQMTGFTFVVFCIYEWNSTFESLTAKFENIKQAKKNIPRGFIISILIAILLYWFTTLATLLNIGNSENEAWNTVVYSEAPLSQSFGLVAGVFGYVFMGIIGMIATLTSISAGIQMSTHLLHSMAKDGFMPKKIALKKNNIEYIALIISTIFVIFMVFLYAQDLFLIAQITNLIFLLSMITMSISIILIRKRRPNIIRPWKIPGYPFTPIIAGISALLLFFTLSGLAIISGIVIVLIGVIYYLMSIARPDRLKYFFIGGKIGALLFITICMLLFEMSFVSTASNSILNYFFSSILAIGGVLLAFEILPIDQMHRKLFKKSQYGEEVIVGNITAFSNKQNRNFLLFNYFLLGFSIFLMVFLLGVFGIIIADIVSIEMLKISMGVTELKVLIGLIILFNFVAEIGIIFNIYNRIKELKMRI